MEPDKNVEMMLRNTAYLIIVLLLSSCQMQKITLNVYEPSRLMLPPNLKYYEITSRYVPATGPYDEVQWGAYQSIDSVKWSLSESLVDSLATLMTHDPLYSVIRIRQPRMLRHNGSDLPEPLPWGGMKGEVEKNRVEAAIVLEGFDILTGAVTTEQEGGMYTAKQNINVTTAWRIYEPIRQRMLDESVYNHASVITGVGKTADESISNLPDEYNARLQACYEAAGSYFDLFRPESFEVDRFYYPDGDSLLEVAATAVQEGNWTKAESKWYFLSYKSEDSIVKSKACYNMALACERDGRLNQAIAYARRSNLIKPNNRSLDYINILNARILDIEDRMSRKEIIRRW